MTKKKILVISIWLAAIGIIAAVQYSQASTQNNTDSCTGTLITTTLSYTCAGTQDFPDDGNGNVPVKINEVTSGLDPLNVQITDGSGNPWPNTNDIPLTAPSKYGWQRDPLGFDFFGNLPPDAIMYQGDTSTNGSPVDIVDQNPFGDGLPFTVIGITGFVKRSGGAAPTIGFGCSGATSDIIAFDSQDFDSDGVFSNFLSTSAQYHCDGSDSFHVYISSAASAYWRVWIVPYDTRQQIDHLVSFDSINSNIFITCFKSPTGCGYFSVFDSTGSNVYLDEGGEVSYWNGTVDPFLGNFIVLFTGGFNNCYGFDSMNECLPYAIDVKHVTVELMGTTTLDWSEPSQMFIIICTFAAFFLGFWFIYKALSR